MLLLLRLLVVVLREYKRSDRRPISTFFPFASFLTLLA